jgi:uncharacterized membrane protein
MSGFQISIFVHLIGFGLLVATMVGGFVLEMQFRRTTEIQQKLTVARSLKSIGIFSPIATLTLLVTGVGNMHFRGYTLLSEGWLTAKILLFVIMLISGIIFAVVSRKRGKIISEMAQGTTPQDADATLKSLNGQVSMFHLVMFVLVLMILGLTVSGAVS